MGFGPNGRSNLQKHDQPTCPNLQFWSFLEFQGTKMIIWNPNEKTLIEIKPWCFVGLLWAMHMDETNDFKLMIQWFKPKTFTCNAMNEWCGLVFDEWGLKLWKLGFWKGVLTLVKVDKKTQLLTKSNFGHNWYLRFLGWMMNGMGLNWMLMDQWRMKWSMEDEVIKQKGKTYKQRIIIRVSWIKRFLKGHGQTN